jgi:hypothetical protein
MYFPHDLAAEIATVLENYDESEGHTYAVEPGYPSGDRLTVAVTAPTGEVTRLVVTVGLL